jgi:hypothetical protein
MRSPRPDSDGDSVSSIIIVECPVVNQRKARDRGARGRPIGRIGNSDIDVRHRVHEAAVCAG